jgi:cytochrome d ubiquinol oxidase subunit I
MDPILLSRIQFTVTIMFHYLFPPISIGLGVLLVFMEGLFILTKKPIYEAMTKFWVRIFGLVFGIGVASGIVMEFQFGSNWSNYSRFVGDVFGSALAAEGIFAFFLESGFLAILLFGWDKVSRRMHFISTVLVALGAMFSAVWITVANSWQQTPAGHKIIINALGQKQAVVENFWQVVFNPSSVIRLTHTLMGAWIMGAFFVMSVSAFYILRRRHEDFARRSFMIALVFGAVVSLAQLASGHFSAMVVAKYQPAKLAAFEGVFKTEEATPLHLMGWPDVETQTVKGSIAVPGGLSFLVHQDFKTPVTGLDKFPRDEWPPLAVPFGSYHLMIALGTFFIGITLLALFMWWRGVLFQQRWLMWVFVLAVAGPVAANQAGWVAAEVGRQPWIVYGLMKTSAGASISVPAGQIVASLVIFTFIYLLLFALFIFMLDRKIKHGPDPYDESDLTEGHKLDDLLTAATRRGKTQYGEMDSAGDLPHGGAR